MLNPALLAQIASYISLAINSAPFFVKAYKDAKEFINGLFASGLITADQQTQLAEHLDEVALAWLNGQTPPAWTVEPDPE